MQALDLSFAIGCFLNIKPYKLDDYFHLSVAGVKTEEIRTGRILAGLRDIWRVFLKSFLYKNLRKSHEKA